uniref:Uncharacterized protein n=1 Tax=Sphaerodactylus townsendi TaxID=933632 RepID=A0ACB8F6Z3_9SAUR
MSPSRGVNWSEEEVEAMIPSVISRVWRLTWWVAGRFPTGAASPTTKTKEERSEGATQVQCSEDEDRDLERRLAVVEKWMNRRKGAARRLLAKRRAAEKAGKPHGAASSETSTKLP